MRALSRRTQEQKERDRVDAYIRDNYEEVIYDAISMNAANIVRQTVAELLYGMSLHGYGKKRLHDVLRWFDDVNKMPGSAMGKKIDAETVIKYMHREFDIDFDSIDPKYESYEEYKSESA